MRARSCKAPPSISRTASTSCSWTIRFDFGWTGQFWRSAPPTPTHAIEVEFDDDANDDADDGGRVWRHTDARDGHGAIGTQHLRRALAGSGFEVGAVEATRLVRLLDARGSGRFSFHTFAALVRRYEEARSSARARARARRDADSARARAPRVLRRSSRPSRSTTKE